MVIASEAQLDALRSRVIPLAAVEAGGRDDLVAWGPATLDGVRVVGLGEVTHGTREFFTLKHRLLEYLVLEHDFSVIAFEADTEGCRALGRYVTTGRGDPKLALRELGHWTWNTAEVLGLLRWIRGYNAQASAERAVRVIGVDPTDRRARSATRDRTMAQYILDLLDGDHRT